MFNNTTAFSTDEKGQSKMDDLPFYCIGFKSAAPEFTLRTRIWASLRAQTLYRTVSGMMNYAKVIKLLYRVENLEVVQLFGGNTQVQIRRLDAALLQVQQGGTRERRVSFARVPGSSDCLPGRRTAA